MKMRRIILTMLILVMLMAAPGCRETYNGSGEKNDGQTQDTSTVNESVKLKYVTYKRDAIINNIEKLNMKIGMESLMLSIPIRLDNIEKYLPIDNIRKIPGGFLIEYPMENSEFALITDMNGIVFGSFLRGNELHTSMEMKAIKKDMTLEDVKNIFPEIAVDATAKKVLSNEKRKDDEIICEVMLKNDQYGKITLKNKNGKIVVADVEIMDVPFSNDTMKEALQQKPEKLENKYTVITSNGMIIAGRKVWNKFYINTKRGLTNAIQQMEETQFLKAQNVSITIKNYYGDEELLTGKAQDGAVGVSERTIAYDGEQFYVDKGEKGERNACAYKYLIERKGRLNNAAMGEHAFYLVNDDSLTYEQLQWNMLSSQSSDRIDFYTVFGEPYYE